MKISVSQKSRILAWLIKKPLSPHFPVSSKKKLADFATLICEGIKPLDAKNAVGYTNSGYLRAKERCKYKGMVKGSAEVIEEMEASSKKLEQKDLSILMPLRFILRSI